ncbi:hypothetical protein COO60DRAFT_115932 [Scenedesmus sp. NREL 46B-D3]|nr:hypothetical protein COO60DRAFT_115932 [Scenedesmus sp. NREL 46B-D3]
MRGGGGGQRWESEEDRLLAHWQGQLGNRWAEVARHIPGRTGQQCAQRWRHTNPSISKGKWTPREDQLLGHLVDTCGVGHWAEIARQMQGRTDQQCLARWTRHLDPAINRGFWTPEEDAQLLALYEAHGSNWSRIAQCLRVRIPHQCRSRFNILARGGGSGSRRVPLHKRIDSAGSGASSPVQQGRHKKQRMAWEVEDEYDEEEQQQQQQQQQDDMGHSHAYEGDCMDGDGSDDAEEAAALLTSFQRDAGAAAAASASAGVNSGPAEQQMGHKEKQQEEQQGLWQWLRQQQWHQLQAQQQAAAQISAHSAALEAMQLPQSTAAAAAAGVQPGAAAQLQLMRQLQLELQRRAGQDNAAAATNIARQHGSSSKSSSSSSYTAIADFGAAATAGRARGTLNIAPSWFCGAHSSGAVGSPSPVCVEATMKHVASLKADPKPLPLSNALGRRGVASPAPSEQQPAPAMLPACTAAGAGGMPAAVVAPADSIADAAAAACRGSVSGSCSPEVEPQPSLDAASCAATTAKAGAGIGLAAGTTAAAAAASHVAALLGSAGLHVPILGCASNNRSSVHAAALVAALNTVVAGSASAAAAGAAAASSMSPSSVPTPQEQALQWLRNQQVRDGVAGQRLHMCAVV